VGCPVVVKAHPGHPETSRRTAELVTKALQGEGAPDGVFALVEGAEAGTTALTDPRVRAASFTGSVTGGRALLDIANSRPDPIPFYGELGSLNPVVVTRGAVEARAETVVSGFAGSMTMGTGQFCTKPGLLLLPSGHGLEDALVSALSDVGPKPMLNARIHGGHHETRGALASRPGVRVLLDGEDGAGADGVAAAPTLLATDARTLLADREALLTECFGPTALVVEYGSDRELHEVAEAMEGNLTAAVHGEEHEATELAGLWRLLQDRAGRLLWNAWPTGVAVTWAQHHGGPWPATTGSLHTSVGMTAGRRFLRPVAYQGTPEALLPPVLRDDNPWDVPRRVNGTLTTADVPETTA
jgi:NADP-dependent aldehyde dehydrogenase